MQLEYRPFRQPSHCKGQPFSKDKPLLSCAVPILYFIFMQMFNKVMLQLKECSKYISSKNLHTFYILNYI